MKSKLLLLLIAVTLLSFPKANFGQTINLGASANFVLYTSGGSVHDNASSHSQITGDIGYYTSGDFLGFGNVDGVMHPGVDAATTACELALQSAVTQINGTTNDYFPGLLLGNGVVFTPGVYSVPGNATLNLDLVLDAQNVPTAQFVIKINGTFSTNAASKVKLVNGAKACNVFWKVDGVVSMATNTTMKGTIIANNSAINMATGDSLEGRLLCAGAGAITIDGIKAVMPLGCGSPVLTGPKLPDLASIACYTIFSSNGALTNSVGTSNVIGDVGNDGIGAITGWLPAAVTGTLHLIQDISTIQAAIDLSKLYDTLNAMVPDIELLYPAQFGNNLTLTPHVYVMNSAAIFTDSLYLDAQGNANGVFVIKIIAGSPALNTSTYSRVKLINGAQAKNVFWLVKGAVNINNYSIFRGTIVVPSGAINLINTGVILDGRALTMVGAITTAGLSAAMPPGCAAAVSPVIDSISANQIVCSGDSVKFTVFATGTGLTYQWRKGTTNLVDGGNISGALTDTLNINPVHLSDAATNYNVVVTGGFPPSVTSADMSLVVDTTIIIITQPVNKVVCAGDSAKFTINATGVISYQWKKGNISLVNGGNISGADSATLTINPVSITDTSSDYHVFLTGSCSNDSSINVSLKLNTAPLITVEPVDKSVCIGDSVSFVVTATGALTYQWRKGNIPLVNGGNISGADSATLIINPVHISDTASNYNVLITGACGPNDSSVYVSLEVNTATVITTFPVSQTICAGDSVSFVVVASGSNLTYQWRRGTVNLVDGINITGATNDTLTINPATIADIANNYNVIVTGTCSSVNPLADSLMSAHEFAILAATAITSTGFTEIHDMNVGISPGVRASITGFPPAIVVNGAIYASDDIAPPGVAAMLIQAKQDLTNAYLFAEGATAPAPATVAGDQGGKTLAPGIYKTTSSLLIQSGDLTLDAQGDENAVWIFQIASGLTTIGGAGGNVVLAGGAKSRNIYWQVGSSATIGNGTSFKGTILSLTSITMNTGSSIDGRLLARNGAVVLSGTNIINRPSDSVTPNNTSVTSVNVSLAFNAAPVITAEPVNQSTCIGNSVSFTVVATGTGLSYQWRKGNVNLTNTGNISGANTSTLTINPVTALNVAANYNVIVYGACLPNDTSVNVSLTLDNPPIITVQPTNQSACLGGTVSFSVTATGTGLTYQWRKGNINLTNIGNISGATTSTLTINPANISDIASNYNVIVTGTCSPSDTSINVSLMFNTPTIVTEPINQMACVGNSISFSVIASGSGLIYQWRKGNVNLTNTGNISGANTAVLTINPVSISDAAADYNIIVSGTCLPSDTSINVYLVVASSPNITTEPTNQTVCSGGQAMFTVNATGAILAYQWRIGTVNLNNSGNISGATSPTLTINPVSISDAATNYNLVITGTCLPNDTSINVSLNVNLLPIALASSNSPVCVGNPINLTAQTVIGATYLWIGPNGFGSTAQNPVILSSVLADSGTYTLVVENITCFSIPSTVNVQVSYCYSNDFNIPEAFSPNGDGINDLFVIRGIENYPKNTFMIFNRWGDKVFEASPYQNNWDGIATMGLRLGTDPLPVGTYFYILDLGNDSDVYKGTIYLNK